MAASAAAADGANPGAIGVGVARARAAPSSADVPMEVIGLCTCLQELATAAGLSGSAWGTLEAGLGIPDAFEDVALLEVVDIVSALDSDILASSFQASAVDKARALRFHRACKLRCGLMPQYQLPPAPAADDAPSPEDAACR